MTIQWRLWLFALCTLAGTTQAREELLPIANGRTLTVHVPDGFSYNTGANAQGEFGFVLIDHKAGVKMQVMLHADEDGVFKDARARRERLHEEFKGYVEQSREGGMQFEELAPKIGAMTTCLFTDKLLAGKQVGEYPEGEYLHLTVAVKSWPGFVGTVMLFSNDLRAPQHLAAMQVLLASIHEKPVPLL